MARKLVLATIGLLAAGGFGLYQLGVHHGTAMHAENVNGDKGLSAGVAPSKEKKVLYWHDPMVPGHTFDKPGKSPFMNMPLVPVYAEAVQNGKEVSIQPGVRQNLGIRTAKVIRTTLAPTLSSAGSIAYNERDVAMVQARSNGYVEKLFVRAPLDGVRAGQPLAELYVADWVAAQEEYLSVKRMTGAGLDGLLEGARQRMRLAGMTEADIQSIESTGHVRSRAVLIAPIEGVVTELGAREGMTVTAGAPLFRINGVKTVWLHADVPENVVGQLHVNDAVEARVPALADSVVTGKVKAIVPAINPTTRTMTVRVELANPKNVLVPGMFATITFTPAAHKDVLVVPTEAVIRTGLRSVVIVAQGGGFVPTKVDLGSENRGQTEIRKGLTEGQEIVVSGQFLIDSEANLKSALSRMADGGSPQDLHRAAGKVEAIRKDSIVLSHGPIPSLRWGMMTMGFTPPAAGMPPDIAIGDHVEFEIRATKKGGYEIVSIKRILAPLGGSSSAIDHDAQSATARPAP